MTLLGCWSLLLCSWAVEKAPSLTPLVDSFPHGVYSQVSVFLLVAMLSQHYPLRSGHPDLPCLKLLRKHPSQIRVGWSPATSCPTRNIAHGWKWPPFCPFTGLMQLRAGKEAKGQFSEKAETLNCRMRQDLALLAPSTFDALWSGDHNENVTTPVCS